MTFLHETESICSKRNYFRRFVRSVTKALYTRSTREIDRSTCNSCQIHCSLGSRISRAPPRSDSICMCAEHRRVLRLMRTD